MPYTFEILHRLRILDKYLPTLRTITQAGGKLSESLHKIYASYCAQTDRKFVIMYGATEATARMAYLPHHMSLKKIGSIGIAIPGGSFTLLDVDLGYEVTRIKPLSNDFNDELINLLAQEKQHEELELEL